MSASISHRNLSAFAFSDADMEFKFNFVAEATGVSDLMNDAVKMANEKFPYNEDIVMVSHEECLNFKKADLKDGTGVFIFDDFDTSNEAFMYVKSADSAIILGTRCLMTVLQEDEPVPVGIKFIHNLSMKNLLICTSGMPRDQRARIRELVNYMGGEFDDTLRENSTHLVTDCVRSIKYGTASQNNIAVMHSNWINDVWKKQQRSEVRIVATDERFDCHKLPVFFNLCFTTTGIEAKLRAQIKSQVEEHGGSYSSSFNKSVDILLMEKEAINSEKCKAAMKLKKLCVNPTWIEDSISSGYSIDVKGYMYEDTRKLKASTPTKDEAPSRFLPDCSLVSEISDKTSSSSVFLSETRTDPPKEDYKSVLKRLSLPIVKKVGNILDAFSVYLSGFDDIELVILGKILSVLGATRIASISPQVTHVFVGAERPYLCTELDKADIDPTILKLEWLVDVVEAKKLVDQDGYTIARPVSKKKAAREKPSPASKKAIMSMSGPFKKPPIPKFTMNTERQDEIDEEMGIVNQYIEPAPSSLQGNFSDDIDVEFLTGMNVFIYGYSDPYQSASVITSCETYGATLVDETFRKDVDYVITSSALLPKLELKVKFKHLVTDKWLEEAVEAESCIEVTKFHKPIVMVPSKPLRDEIFVVSNYKGNQRIYLQILVNSMGGNFSEVFKRAESPILISPNNEGLKFESAKSFGLTVVNIEWLMECREKKRRVNETAFLVGGTKASKLNILSRDSILPSSQVDEFDPQVDEFDPPIENFADDTFNTTPVSAVPRRLRTAATPTTPKLNLSPSRLLVGMSEPRRTITHNALLEKRKILSPRRKQNSEDSEPPRPAASSRIGSQAINFGLRPDASPDSQAFHKRKLEALDHNYLSRSTHKKKRVEEKIETPPAAVRRYDFFKSRIPSFDSPDPRAAENLGGGLSRITNEVSKNLRFSDYEEAEVHVNGVNAPIEESVNETLPEFKHLTKPTAFTKKPSRLKLMVDEIDNRKVESMPPLESENLVEWADSSQQFSQNVEPSSSDVVSVPIKEYIFAFSQVEESEKKKLTKIINDLGGKIDLNLNFTHLLTSETTRSEKLYVAMATGSFVLHPSYIFNCSAAKKMIREDEYEFGNPKFSSEQTGVEPKNDKLTRGPYKWRKWIKTDYKLRFSDGAFTNRVFIIAASSEKKSSFTNVLTAGGGKIVDIDIKSPLSENILKRASVNTCLFDKQNAPSKANIQILKSCKIALESVTFINQYLFSDELP